MRHSIYGLFLLRWQQVRLSLNVFLPQAGHPGCAAPRCAQGRDSQAQAQHELRMLQFGERRAPGMLLSERALHCPGGSLATPQGHCVRSDPEPDGNFLFKGCPERVSSGEPSLISAVLAPTSAHGFQSPSCSDSRTRALDMQLGCPDFFLLSGDFFFSLHLHLVNKNLPDISLWICQTGQSCLFFFFFLILFMSFC